MKIQSLTIKNIGLIADTKIEIDKPLLVFYGEIRQGKTTILNCVRWVCGGAFPADIIRHGEKEASIELGLDGGCVTRSWYRTKEAEGKPSEVKARPVQFVRNGKPVPSPAAELKRLMNPFLLDQDFLRNKTELERKQYFSELFAVDTTDLDSELFNVQRKAQDLRAKLSGYGEIDLTPVETVDTDAIKSKIFDIRTAHRNKVQEAQKQKAEKLQEWNKQVSAVRQQNQDIALVSQRRNTAMAHIPARKKQIETLQEQVKRLQAEITSIELDIKTTEQWLNDNPAKEQLILPNQPATSDLDEIIASVPDVATLEASLETAAAQNVRAEQHKKNVERDNLRKADEAALKAAEDRGREIKKEKIAKLAQVSETCGVPGLTFAEDGTFAFERTAAGMLSTSQIMRLSSALSALYPEGLSIELVDRGESLGRSIFDYVKHAEAKKVSVLATVVGQKPANVPEKVGVFCVKDGIIFKDGEDA